MRSAAICMGGLLINQTVGQLGSALLARWIPSASLYGALSLLLQLLNMAALALGLGLDNAVVYDVATGRPDAARGFVAARNGMVILAALPVALCVVAAHWTASAYGVPGLAGALRIGALVLFGQAALNATTALQSGLRRFGAQMTLLVSATALAAAGRLAALPLILHGASLGWVALAGGCGTLLAAVGGMRLARRSLPGPASVRKWFLELPRMLRYGWPLWAGNLLKSFQQPYLVLVAGGVGIAAAGYVSNDVALIGWPFLVTWAFRLVAVPLVAAAHEPTARRERITLCFRLNHLALFPVVAVLCLWPHQILAAIYGARYAQDANILPLLALGVYGSSVGRLTTDALAAVNQTKASLPIMGISSLPLLLGAPLALAHGALWLGGLYCVGWLASAAFAYTVLVRVGPGVSLRSAFLEPLLPTLCALPLGLWATHSGGVVAVLATATVLVVMTVVVYQTDTWRGTVIGMAEARAPSV